MKQHVAYALPDGPVYAVWTEPVMDGDEVALHGYVTTETAAYAIQDALRADPTTPPIPTPEQAPQDVPARFIPETPEAWKPIADTLVFNVNPCALAPPEAVIGDTLPAAVETDVERIADGVGPPVEVLLERDAAARANA